MADERFDKIEDVFVGLWRISRKSHLPEEVMEITTKEGLDKARRLVNDAIANNLISAAAMARRTGLKESAISAFRNEKWKGAATAEVFTAEQCSRFLNQLMREREAKESELGGFVTTRFAEAVFAIAHWAVKRRKIAAFVAHAGHGKSMAIDALVQEIAGAVKVTVTSKKGTPRLFLQSIAEVFNVAPYGRAADIQDRVTLFLRTSTRPLFVDEAHKLTIGSLDCLREIWDEAKSPMILAATPSLYQTLHTRRVGTVTSELMDQLYRRVAMFRDLTALEDTKGNPQKVVSIDDLRKVFARSKVRLSADGFDFLCKLANAPGAGGLGVCADLVQLSIDLWPDTEITFAHLRSALKTRVGGKECAALIVHAEVFSKAAVAASA
jgi:DNA transposition AAA+ family ATPase